MENRIEEKIQDVLDLVDDYAWSDPGHYVNNRDDCQDRIKNCLHILLEEAFNERNFYLLLSLLFKNSVEGELIQDIYFYFKTLKLEDTNDRDDNGIIIPNLENISDMQKQLAEMFEKRHNTFIANNLYNQALKYGE